MPIDANRARLLRQSLEGVSRTGGPVLTLGVKVLEDDLTLFKDLGYGDIESVDVSDFEGATYVADLNQPVADNMRGRFALIYNGGTIEHIFDVRTVMRNLHDMLTTNGVMVHVGPMNGWVEHGFYQFNPTFFADFYHANRYEPCRAFLLHAISDNHRDVEVHHYLPGKFDNYAAGAFPGVWNFFMPFVKRSSSTWDQIPQQGYYVRLYGKKNEAPKPAFDDAPPFVLRNGKPDSLAGRPAQL